MSDKLKDALVDQKQQTEQYNQKISGILGITINGAKTVEVANRNSYVYVRLRNTQNELIQAFNNRVAPSYNLPVLVERQGNRYVVLDVDTKRYDNNWGSFSPYLPRHGNTHSFDIETGGGGDIVWVYPRQFMPLLALPSGSVGSPNVIISPYTLKNENGTWKYVGNTGTASFTPYNPVSSGSVMGLIALDTTSGNPYLLINSGSVFHYLTGSSQIYPYIPTLTNPMDIPIAAVRLVSGTSRLTWDNIYDVRQFVHSQPTGSAGGISSVAIQDEGTPQGNATTLNFVGDPVTATVSGSVARISITATASGSSGGSPAFTGTGNSAVLTSSSGTLFTPAWLKWGTSTNEFLEFGADEVKEANAGRMGYNVFNNGYFDIVGAGTGTPVRRVRILDDLFVLENISFGGAASGTVFSATNSFNLNGTNIFDIIQNETIPNTAILHNGWKLVSGWTRTGNHAYTTNGDSTIVYRKGTKIRYKDAGVNEYGVIASSVVTGSTTFTNLIPNTDYLMNTGITDTYISYIENPEDFPHWFNWNANPQGFSVVPPSPVYRWMVVGRTITLNYNEPNNGTSDATTFSATAPVAGSSLGSAWTLALGTTVNNGILLTIAGRMFISAGSTLITFRTDAANGAWTAALGKRAVGTLIYEF